MKYIIFFLLVGVVCPVTGCGDAFKDNNPDGNLSSSQKFYVSRAQIICEKNEKCCAEAGVTATSASSCIDRASAERQGSWFDEDLAAGYLTFDETRANQCLTALEALSCSEWKALVEGETLDDCLRIYVARQNEGDKCQHDEACLTHHCRQLPEVDGEKPGYGLCDGRTADGEACFSSASVSQDCDHGLICFSESIYAADTCHALLKEGEKCSDNKQCYGGVCDSNSSLCATSCQFDPDDRAKNILRHW